MPAGDSDTLCDIDGSHLLLEKSKVGMKIVEAEHLTQRVHC